MAASISTGSATSRNAPNAKKKKRRSSTNLKNPRRRSRKKKNPMLPCPSGKNPARRNPRRKNRKKNPNHPQQAAATGRPCLPGVRCEAHSQGFPHRPESRSRLRAVWLGIRADATPNHLRSDTREDFHACEEHHRGRH